MKNLNLLLVSLLLHIQCALYAQIAPGGISDFTKWLKSGKDTVETIGNYPSLSSADLDSIRNQINALNQPHSVFVVVKPKFLSATNSMFLKIGQSEIWDNKLRIKNKESAINFELDRPRIISFEVSPLSHYGHAVADQVEFGDSSLFSIGEIIVFPRILERAERRKVASYLALKYSVTITKNAERQWRSYLGESNDYYWHSSLDRYFEHEVIGLGRNNVEDWFQSQTYQESEFPIQVGLDTLDAIGKMPQVTIRDKAFLVFSKSIVSPSHLNACEYDTTDNHPLDGWKMKFHHWSSSASSIWIRVENYGGGIDSLVLADGFHEMPLVDQDQNPNTVTYTIPFNQLDTNRQYFFKARGFTNSLCDPVDTISGLSSLSSILGSNDSLSILLQDSKTGEWKKIGFDDLGDYTLNEGQYQIVISDKSQNQLFASQVLLVSGDSVVETDPLGRLQLYPNPLKAGERLFITVPEDIKGQSFQILIADGFGKLVYNQRNIPTQNGTLSANFEGAPGLYTIVVRSEDDFFISKIILQ